MQINSPEEMLLLRKLPRFQFSLRPSFVFWLSILMNLSKQPISDKQPFLINNANPYSFANHTPPCHKEWHPFTFSALFALDSLKH